MTSPRTLETVSIRPMRAEDADEARQMTRGAAEIVVSELDDGWTRDTGPTFLVDDVGGGDGDVTAVEQARGYLAGRGGADEVLCMGEAADDGGADGALEVDGEIVAGGLQS